MALNPYSVYLLSAFFFNRNSEGRQRRFALIFCMPTVLVFNNFTFLSIAQFPEKDSANCAKIHVFREILDLY
jgi:hypothetical protein